MHRSCCKKIIYFTDGSVSQYKNTKNVPNLCHHLNDSGLEPEWNFFATDHGKNACDGIGGTTKREATKKVYSLLLNIKY